MVKVKVRATPSEGFSFYFRGGIGMSLTESDHEVSEESLKSLQSDPRVTVVSVSSLEPTPAAKPEKSK